MRVGALRMSLLLAVLGVVLFFLHLLVGPVAIGWRDVSTALLDAGANGPSALIIRTVRLPEAITATIAGAGLAACGLLMQTLFRNPLAGPSVLGISSGASLGVAILLLAQPLWMFAPVPADLGIVIGAFSGAMGVLLLIMLADRRMGDGVALLIVGLMVGYLCSAIINVLQVASSEAALRGFVLWGMGSFGDVINGRLAWLALPVLAGILVALLLVKPLNALLLGDAYAASLGVPVKRTRRLIMWTTGVLAGTITAFCGPIAFLGLATPHVARGLCRTSDHAVLMPVTILCGAALALFCDLLIKLPGVGAGIPLNAVTSLLGAPVVAWVLLSGKRWARTA
ncbi:MAG: iron ABC transporter permease [Flavobacteriales bacterium]|nr:iron ABC transporter permease [Flavobacteriales bacterium]